jgi:hypothetical protein
LFADPFAFPNHGPIRLMFQPMRLHHGVRQTQDLVQWVSVSGSFGLCDWPACVDWPACIDWTVLSRDRHDGFIDEPIVDQASNSQGDEKT